MKFQNEKQILNIIKYTPPLFILLILFMILSILFIENKQTFNKEKAKIETAYIKENKKLIKDQVNSVYDFIKREQKITEIELKNSLSIALKNAHTTINSIYKNNQDKSTQELKKIVVDALRNIRFNDGRGYFFIYDKNGKNIMLPPVPELEGKDFINHKDAKGTYIVKDMIKELKNKKETFYEWYWYKPNDNSKQRKKIGLVKNFEPFNWFIGTGEYIDDFEKNIQEKVLRHIKEIRYGKNGYIFIINYDSVYLNHIRKEFIGKHAVTNKDTKKIKIVINDLIKLAKDGDGYYSYIQNKKPGNNETVKKTSYVKGLQNWQWMIGTGFYEDDLQAIIHMKKLEYDLKFNNYIKNALSTAFLLTLVLLLMSIYFSKTLKQKFDKYKDEIELYNLDNEKHQAIISQQSKMASMGEMIGNIAHQWRQPLSTITTTATGIQLHKEIGLLEDELLIEGLKSINQSAQHLSTTIDDFRNFFKTDKNKNNFKIKKALDTSMSLTSVQFHNKNITIIKDIEDIEIKAIENELVQVIVNVLNNARDELIKKEKSEERLIFINAKLENENIKIKIIDNAGGIKNADIQKIFEPYFTTKEKTTGTGIGLYMSKEIIEKNMYGTLGVKNTSYIYNDKEHTGAMFEIVLAIK